MESTVPLVSEKEKKNIMNHWIEFRKKFRNKECWFNSLGLTAEKGLITSINPFGQ